MSEREEDKRTSTEPDGAETESGLFDNVALDTTTPDKGTQKTQKTVENLPPLEERYKQSTSEAIKLKKLADNLKEENESVQKQIESYKTFDPFIKALNEDPDFAKHALAYFDKEKESLVLDEGFDADELSNPNSKSRKIFNDAVAQKVREELKAFQQASMKDNAISDMKRNFLARHPDKSESYLKELEKKAQKIPFDYEAMEYLVNRDSERNKIAEEARKDIDNQISLVGRIPRSLTGIESNPNKPSETDQLFAKIKAAVDKTSPLG